MALAEGAGQAGPVLVVRSTSHPAMGEAVEGLRSRCGCEVQVAQITGDEAADRRSMQDLLGRSPAAVVALGEAAAATIRAVQPDQALLAAFVERPSTLSQAAGVSSEPRPDLELDQLLKIKPQVKRLGVLFDPAQSREEANEAARVAKARGLTVVLGAADSALAVPRVFRDVIGRVDALLLLPSNTTVASREALSYLVLGSLEKDVPLYTRSETLVRGGALFALTIDPREVGESLGSMVSQLLANSGKTVDLGWRRPARYELVLNRRTARNLDLSAPGGGASGSVDGDLARQKLGGVGGTASAVAEVFIPAKAVRQTRPELPKTATVHPGAGSGDMVVVRVKISREGKLMDSSVLTGSDALKQAALQAVKSWEFAPATRDGAAVESDLVVTVDFVDGR